MATRKLSGQKPRSGKRGQPADPEFEAEIEAAAEAHYADERERNADFAAGWAKRLGQPVAPVLPSEIHRHTDAECGPVVERLFRAHGEAKARMTKLRNCPVLGTVAV